MKTSNVLAVLEELEAIEQVAASTVEAAPVLVEDVLTEATSALFEALGGLASAVEQAKTKLALFSEALQEALEDDDSDNSEVSDNSEEEE